MKLAPLLLPEAMSVCSALETEDHKSYDKVKEALYQISPATYARNIEKEIIFGHLLHVLFLEHRILPLYKTWIL